MIDSKDRAILTELHKDGRQSDAAIARKLGISGASVRRRIEHMVDAGVMSLTAVVSPSKIGYDISASIGIHANLQVLDRLVDLLVAMPQVHYVATSTGRFDVTIMVTFRSAEELAGFIQKDLSLAPGYISSETLMILETAKHSQDILLETPWTPERRQRYGKSARRKGAAEPKINIDEYDYNIMLELQRDARVSDATIARKLGTSQATVGRRIRRLLRTKLITIVPVIIPAMVGYPTVTTIGIKVDLSQIDSCIEALVAQPRLHFVGLAAGRYDVLAWATFRSPAELAKFMRKDLSHVPGVLSTETAIALKVKKRDLRYLPDNSFPLSEFNHSNRRNSHSEEETSRKPIASPGQRRRLTPAAVQAS